jgi:hypothetical protein
MKLIRKLSGILFLSLIAGHLTAQNNGCTIRKAFLARDGTYLRILNKFGDINLITAKNDSVSICATIIVKQDDKDTNPNSN